MLTKRGITDFFMIWAKKKNYVFCYSKSSSLFQHRDPDMSRPFSEIAKPFGYFHLGLPTLFLRAGQFGDHTRNAEWSCLIDYCRVLFWMFGRSYDLPDTVTCASSLK